MTRSPALWSRCLVVLIALLLGLSGPALAKKKRGGKRGKTPAAKKVKGKSGKAATPVDTGGADDGSDDGDSDEEESPPSRSKPETVPDEEAEDSAPKSARRSAPPVTRKAAEEDDGGGDGEIPFALQVGVGGSALFRNAVWTDNQANVLAPYKLSPGPQGSVWFEAYPGAFATGGFAANIGLVGRFDQGFGVSSRNPAGMDLATKFQSYMVGLKVRFPLGMFIPYASASYGGQYFLVEGANVPYFQYSIIRPMAGTRVALSPTMDLDFGLGYLLSDPGAEVKADFPNASAYGLDVAASFGARFTDLIGVRAGVDLRQYGVTLGQGTAGAVGGGVDRYITAWAGIEVVLGASGGGGSSSDDDTDDDEKPTKKAAKKADKKPADEEESSDDE